MYMYHTAYVHAKWHTYPPKVHRGGLVPPPMTNPQGPKVLPYKVHTWWYMSTMRMGQGDPALSRVAFVKMEHNEVSVCVQCINITPVITGRHTRSPRMIYGQIMLRAGNGSHHGVPPHACRGPKPVLAVNPSGCAKWGVDIECTCCVHGLNI